MVTKLKTVIFSVAMLCIATVAEADYTDNWSWSDSGGRCTYCQGNPIYSFTTGGEQITITLDSNVDAYLYLMNRSGKIVAEDDDSNGNLNSQITGTFPSDFYTIIAATYYDNQSGSYTLNISGDASSPRRQVLGGSWILEEGNIGDSEYITLPSYGETYDTYLNIPAKANYSDYSGDYQCVELIKRFTAAIYGIDSYGDGKEVASNLGGKKGHILVDNLTVELDYYQDSSQYNENPINGSIISFYGTDSIPQGHVAIVKGIYEISNHMIIVTLFEQNYSYNSTIAHSRTIIFERNAESNWTWFAPEGSRVKDWVNPYLRL